MTEGGKKSADKFSVAESQIMDNSKHKCRDGNVTRFSKEFAFYFFNRAISSLKITDNTLLDFSVFLHLSLSVQFPCLRFPDNSHVCFAQSPSSQRLFL